MSKRVEVLRLYKQLLWTAKSYPNKPYSEIRQKIKNAFLKNANITDKTELQNAIDKGKYIIKEMESLIFLAKYRTMKRRYYDTEEEDEKSK